MVIGLAHSSVAIASMAVALSGASPLASPSAALPSATRAPTHRQDHPSPLGRSEFEAGRRLFESGEVERACPLFEAAYRRSGRPAAVFALAQCERMLGHHHRAIEHFEEYLARNRRAKNRDEVERTVGELRALLIRRAHVDEPPRPRRAELPSEDVHATNLLTPGLGPRADLILDGPADRPPSWIEHPAFWVVVGVVVAGGASVAGVLFATPREREPYRGSSGVLLEPRD